MNKDVIYIDPENDITDIIDKVKTSKSKVIALVPPKKSSVLSSTVNFKLLARASRVANKSIVLVTADTALMKLASVAEIPIAKTLQSRPEIPIIIKDGTAVKEKSDDGTVDDEEGDELIKEAKKSAPEKPTEAETIEIIESEEDAKDDEDPEEDVKSDKKSKKDSKVPSLDRYRKWIIIGAVSLVLLAGFLVWALIFAPAVKVTVAVTTTAKNFSQTISFTTDPKKEILDEGIFALETVDLSKKSTHDFVATGEVNKGNKASGTITTFYTFNALYTTPITIPSGTTFKNDNLTFTSTSATTISYDPSKCEDDSPALTCRITAKIPVSAGEPGERYNVTSSTGWTSSNSYISHFNSAISGGTDKLVKVVSQADFDKAKSLLTSASQSTGRTELLNKFPDSTFPIDGSFSVENKDPISTPKVGEEVKEGVTPQISAETVFSMRGVDRIKISQFIEKKVSVDLPKGQKIHATGVSMNPDENKARIENFQIDGENITAKLVSSFVQIGPDINEAKILEKIKGRKVGEVSSILKDLTDSKLTVDIEKSVPWVSSIPDDPNKIEIILTIEQ